MLKCFVVNHLALSSVGMGLKRRSYQCMGFTEGLPKMFGKT